MQQHVWHLAPSPTYGSYHTRHLWGLVIKYSTLERTMPVHPDYSLRFASCCSFNPGIACVMVVPTSVTLELLFLSLCSNSSETQCNPGQFTNDPFEFDPELDTYRRYQSMDLTVGSSGEVEVFKIQTLCPQTPTSSHVGLYIVVSLCCVPSSSSHILFLSHNIHCSTSAI